MNRTADLSASAHDNVSVLRARTAAPVRSDLQGTLALELEPLLDPPPAVRTTGTGRRSASRGTGPAAGPGADVLPIDLRVRRELERWAHRYCQAAVEIAGGDRPSSQLSRWTTGEVMGDLSRRAHLISHAARTGGRSRVHLRPQVRSVHACFVNPRTAEVSAHVRYGRRSRAVAARFERRADRWVCTALEFA